MPLPRGAGPQGLSLGHVDMLRHLTRHSFLPSRRIRLIHLYDLWRYQAVFGEEIDWRTLAADFPGVVIALQLVAYAFTGAVSVHQTLDRAAVPTGVGMGMVALSEIAAANEGILAKLSELFNPPAWWVHGFYGVAPGRSLLLCGTGSPSLNGDAMAYNARGVGNRHFAPASASRNYRRGMISQLADEVGV